MPSQASDLAASPTKTGVLKSKPQFRNHSARRPDDAAQVQAVHARAKKLTTRMHGWVSFYLSAIQSGGLLSRESDGIYASINVDRRAGDKAVVFRCEESDCSRHISGTSRSSERNSSDCLGGGLRRRVGGMKRGFQNQTGATAFTRMPNGPSSEARLRVIVRIAPLHIE